MNILSVKHNASSSPFDGINLNASPATPFDVLFSTLAPCLPAQDLSPHPTPSHHGSNQPNSNNSSAIVTSLNKGDATPLSFPPTNLRSPPKPATPIPSVASSDVSKIYNDPTQGGPLLGHIHAIDNNDSLSFTNHLLLALANHLRIYHKQPPGHVAAKDKYISRGAIPSSMPATNVYVCNGICASG